MSDPSPHSPAPAYPPSGSRGPDWTTGQGIGFLVALPGWILVPLGVIGAIVASSFAGGDRALSLISLGVAIGGLILAVPGTIVFTKCKRR